ncbi:hypothetical protein B0H14DRAFT_2649149 [Mycena olivaceomarginata]|nr:hypothetical protein B0H14DRAFT_2649149 [Mycena olivaceomarginata]
MGKRKCTSMRTSTTRDPRQAKQQCLQSPSHSQISGGRDENTDDTTQATHASQDDPPSVQADMTYDELYEVACHLEADHANSQQAQREAHRDALVDVTNRQEDIVHETSAKELDFIASAGKKIIVTCMLWLPAGQENEIWGMEEDDVFNLLDRLETRDSQLTRSRAPQRYLCRRVETPNKFYYDTTNIPILHKDYEGKYNLAKFFLHESLFITRKGTCRHYSRTRHCGGYEGRGSPAQGPVSNRALEFAVHYTGNGSGGQDLEWQEDFKYYLQLLTEGLQKKKPSILNIFCVWDRKFYPNSEDRLAHSTDPNDEGVEGRWAALEEMNAKEPEDDSEVKLTSKT